MQVQKNNPKFLLGDIPLCSIWGEATRNCQNEVNKAYRNNEFTCPCNPACEDRYYSKDVSITDWPNVPYTPYLVERLRKYSDSDLILNYLNSVLNDTSATVEQINEKMRLNFARIEIYFQNLNFEQVTEKPSYTMTQLITDFGGNIGLWIGWSVLTFLEIAVFLVNTVKIITTGTL